LYWKLRRNLGWRKLSSSAMTSAAVAKDGYKQRIYAVRFELGFDKSSIGTSIPEQSNHGAPETKPKRRISSWFKSGQDLAAHPSFVPTKGKDSVSARDISNLLFV
jgi:hypothetical protein